MSSTAAWSDRAVVILPVGVNCPLGNAVTATVDVVEAPALLVTVSLYVVFAVIAAVVFATPLVTVPTPLSIDPAPFVNTAVIVATFPAQTLLKSTLRLEMDGAGTVAVELFAPDEPPVAVVPPFDELPTCVLVLPAPAVSPMVVDPPPVDDVPPTDVDPPLVTVLEPAELPP